jgi:hypothetical protein
MNDASHRIISHVILDTIVWLNFRWGCLLWRRRQRGLAFLFKKKKEDNICGKQGKKMASLFATKSSLIRWLEAFSINEDVRVNKKQL